MPRMGMTRHLAAHYRISIRQHALADGRMTDAKTHGASLGSPRVFELAGRCVTAVPPRDYFCA